MSTPRLAQFQDTPYYMMFSHHRDPIFLLTKELVCYDTNIAGQNLLSLSANDIRGSHISVFFNKYDELASTIEQTFFLGIPLGCKSGFFSEISGEFLSPYCVPINNDSTVHLVAVYFLDALHKCEAIENHDQLQEEMYAALKNKEFTMFYQPQIDVQNNTVVGAEALIRWIHPSRGFIPPSQFIHLAEETGLIVPIGEWILREVSVQIQRWSKKSKLLDKIAVNVSSQQLKQNSLLHIISSLVNSSLDPRYLQLELTETTMITNLEYSAEMMKQIKKQGLSLAIDDFGTGFSSLSYLKKLPLDTIKIDRSFITNVTNSADDAKIVSSIISIAEHFNLDVVAEGVETQDQLTYLREQNCYKVQGFLFSPPVPKEIFESFLI